MAKLVVRWRWWVIGLWVVAAIAIIALCPKLSSVESNDQSSFLPHSYESVQASEIAAKASAMSNKASDILVFQNSQGTALNQAQLGTITMAIQKANSAHISHVLAIAPAQLSKDGTTFLASVVYDGNDQDTALFSGVDGVRSNFSTALKGSGIVSALTGQVAISKDTQGSFQKALSIVSIGTIILVLLLPAIIFRSPFIGLLPVAAVGLVYSMSSSLIAALAHVFDFKVNQQLSVLFTVVLFGIGTDYTLFLLFRYRERLRSGDHSRDAVAYAMGRAGEAIFSAALVVLSSFAALFFAKFGIFHSLAPGLVVCVAVMMIASLTLIPALLAVIGEKVFWPSKAWQQPPKRQTLYGRLGKLISRRPLVASVILIVGLLAISAFTLNYKADFSSFSQPSKGTESADAYARIEKAYPAGVLNPIQVYLVKDSGFTTTELMADAEVLSHSPHVTSAYPQPNQKPGKIATIVVTLDVDPYSSTAITTVRNSLHNSAHSLANSQTQVYVGGATAAIADVQAVTNRDFSVIFPVAAVFILVILAILLQSIVAPIIMLIAVGIGFLATLGATALIFITIGGQSGVISFLPMFLYLFVVAVGTDYNILTITRLREEIQEGAEPHKAADMTIEHSSSTVGSAGIILAGTFGSLMLAGITFLTQMGATIAVGVLLAAMVIAPMLLPALSVILGRALWWPRHKISRAK